VLIALVTRAPLQRIGLRLYRGGIRKQVSSIQTRKTSGILSNECGQPSLLTRLVEWSLGAHATPSNAESGVGAAASHRNAQNRITPDQVERCDGPRIV